MDLGWKKIQLHQTYERKYQVEVLFHWCLTGTYVFLLHEASVHPGRISRSDWHMAIRQVHRPEWQNSCNQFELVYSNLPSLAARSGDVPRHRLLKDYTGVFRFIGDCHWHFGDEFEVIVVGWWRLERRLWRSQPEAGDGVGGSFSCGVCVSFFVRLFGALCPPQDGSYVRILSYYSTIYQEEGGNSLWCEWAVRSLPGAILSK